jgi:hypothetical protein
MADDPFANYTAPATKSADPFANYQPPSSAPAAAQPQGWPDYLLGHLHSLSQGLDAATRVATDAPTFGLMDKLFGSQAQADTAADYKQMGKWSLPLSIAGGAVTGLPELKAASAIGETAAPYLAKLPLTGQGKWLGGVLGMGGVGGATSALAEYGHEQGWTPDVGRIAKAGGIGGALSAGFGALGGVVGRGGELPTSPTAQSYFDQAEQEYKPLSNLVYDAKNEVHPALDVTDAQNAQRDWSGKRWDDATKTRGEVEALLDKPQLSADDIHQSQKYLRDKVINSPTADPNDQTYAGYYRDKLQEVLENGLPSTGVPQNLPPGVSPSNYAAYVKSRGDFLTGQGRDMQRADVWSAVGATPAGKDIGAQAGSWLSDQAARAAAKKPGVWADPGTPYYDATTALAKTTAQSTPLTWTAKHFLLAPLAFTAAGEGFNALSGGEGMGHQPWWARLGEEAGAGLMLSGGMAGYRALTGAANVAEQQAAEAGLRSTIASRTMQNPAGTLTQHDPIAPQAPIRAALRTLGLDLGGRGAYQAR